MIESKHLLSKPTVMLLLDNHIWFYVLMTVIYTFRFFFKKIGAFKNNSLALS